MRSELQEWCPTKVDKEGNFIDGMDWGYCGPGCPSKDDAWKTDETLKLIHHKFDLKDTIIALKLLGIMSFSLLLIALMVKVLGISAIWFCKYEK